VDPTNSPYAYGHGYVVPSNQWRTIMAYGDACGNCTRIQYFSNPSISYQGAATGTSSTNDVARVHRDRVSTVAAFRSPPPPPPAPVAVAADPLRNASRLVPRRAR
jgi:hypothetical protein